MVTTPNIAPPIFYDQAACPVRNVLQVHLGKWPVLILIHVSFGQHRFTELLNAIPDISQRMLTQTLRNLEKDGLVSRHVTACIPPRVDYDITKLGQTLLPVLESLLEWGASQRTLIEQNRIDYDKVATAKAQSEPQPNTQPNTQPCAEPVTCPDTQLATQLHGASLGTQVA